MRTTRLIAILAGIATIAVVVADADAMYHPTVGRFLQRDPGPRGPMRVGATGPTGGGRFARREPAGQYADGMNLYQYVRSGPLVHVDPYGTTTMPHTSVQDYWGDWAGSHPGLNDIELANAKKCLKSGCVGVVGINVGKTTFDGLLGDCYDSLGGAEQRRRDTKLKKTCCRKKDVDGRPARLRIITMKFWGYDNRYDRLLLDNSDANGKVDMKPYLDEVGAGRLPVKPPDEKHPKGWMNFDFALLDESSGEWLSADQGEVPEKGMKMQVYKIDRKTQDLRMPWQAAGGLAQVWCVVCNDWRISSTTLRRGAWIPQQQRLAW